MVEKIDLRQKGEGNYPPDIAKLIAQCGSINKAEKFVGIGQGAFGKIRRGEHPYSDYVKMRVDAALAGNPIPKDAIMKRPDAKPLTDACPPILADLIRHCGTKAKAAKVLGTSEGTLYGVIAGKPMPAAWVTRAKAHMGLPVIGPREVAPPPPDQGPPFVAWDGKTKGTFKTKAHGKSPSRSIKNVPQPLLDLLTKYNGVVQQASRAVGTTGNTLFKWMEGMEFTEERQRKVFAALHDLPQEMKISQDYDRYELGLAVVMVSGAVNFDRLQDVAEILNGKIIFKKNTKSGWLLIYKMAIDDLPRFKKLGMRDANEIVCP